MVILPNGSSTYWTPFPPLDLRLMSLSPQSLPFYRVSGSCKLRTGDQRSPEHRLNNCLFLTISLSASPRRCLTGQSPRGDSAYLWSKTCLHKERPCHAERDSIGGVTFRGVCHLLSSDVFSSIIRCNCISADEREGPLSGRPGGKRKEDSRDDLASSSGSK